jgi:hypothetical protein
MHIFVQSNTVILKVSGDITDGAAYPQLGLYRDHIKSGLINYYEFKFIGQGSSHKTALKVP